MVQRPIQQELRQQERAIWGATGSAKSKTALFLFKILWYDKHSHTHYTVLH